MDQVGKNGDVTEHVTPPPPASPRLLSPGVLIASTEPRQEMRAENLERIWKRIWKESGKNLAIPSSVERKCG